MQTASEMRGTSRTDRQVARLKEQAEQAIYAINWLSAEGYEPLEVIVQRERSAPVIRIALSQRAHWLKTEFGAWKHLISNEYTIWRCLVMGVRVQWVERGN